MLRTTLIDCKARLATSSNDIGYFIRSSVHSRVVTPPKVRLVVLALVLAAVLRRAAAVARARAAHALGSAHVHVGEGVGALEKG